MKIAPIARPLWIALAGLCAVGILGSTTWTLHRENGRLRAEHAARRTASSGAKSDEPAASVSPMATDSKARLAELREQIARETAARTTAETRVAKLARQLTAKDGEITVSFGRIEEMGQQGARLARFLAKSVEGKAPPVGASDPTYETEAKELFGKFVEQLPELSEMENRPSEIARYLASVLGEFYTLGDAPSHSLTPLLETEFKRLKALELNATHRPSSDPSEWDRRRDAAVTELAARVRTLLPADREHLDMLPGLLDLGRGLRSEVQINPDGRSVMLFKLPLLTPGKL
jgi:hypothetical protein